MDFQELLADFARRAAEGAKVKLREVVDHVKETAPLQAKLEVRRTQSRAFRLARDYVEPPAIPKWIERGLRAIGDEEPPELPELPFRADAEPFLVVAMPLARRFEINRGWLSGRIRGRHVRFVLDEQLKARLLDVHDPIRDLWWENVRLALRREQELAALVQVPGDPIPEHAPDTGPASDTPRAANPLDGFAAQNPLVDDQRK